MEALFYDQFFDAIPPYSKRFGLFSEIISGDNYLALSTSSWTASALCNGSASDFICQQPHPSTPIRQYLIPESATAFIFASLHILLSAVTN